MWNLVGAIALLSKVQVSQLEQQAVRIPISLLSSLTSPIVLASASSTSDPDADLAVKSLLLNLKKEGYNADSQGIWMQTSNGTILADHNGTKPISAASLTKIATTLTALDTWGSNYQFITKVSTTGRIVGNTLQGDLIIQGSTDPLFVWEDAIAIGNAINRLGIYRVQGNLIVTKGFYMNFETDPKLSTTFLRQAINSQQWTAAIQRTYQSMTPQISPPQVLILGKSLYTSAYPTATTPLLEHSSLPLWQILKRMNIFSNNDMAEILASSLGGGKVIAQKVTNITGLSGEVRLINGSGLGQQNQISPRATVAMLIAIQNLAQAQGLSLADLFASTECRCGTIRNRNLPLGAIVKTGTLSDVSALGGVFQTRDRGTIWFAILNRGAGDIDIFHRGQDQVLLTLTQKWGQGIASNFPNFPSFKPIPWQERNRSEVILPLLELNPQ
ncbi:D-alanyl-D-alanine carboxypeptidase (penicillin-binding protein 4) [Synechococcus sp. PCC 7502]|uniref:D-alanyl-D-alanine carboxypeptidase n=1 Tax=Synechococcus sp. PCC 7502 TaxID=1173263 RepID=UPI00029FE762|nr:D-alanyl-D-alanine carboxypeptidase [Synechococcus sp. PCC 7502]AFY74115.1 D-alanyl-D-alanine carboxypeptidase (penicillin-binding protein 4) [Synechococcus sp. PCC 7502]